MEDELGRTGSGCDGGCFTWDYREPRRLLLPRN